MIRRLSTAVLVAVAAACGGGGGSTTHQQAPKTPVTYARTVEGVRTLLGTVAAQGRTMVGQQCGDGDDIEARYQAGVVALETLSGRSVALIGADYGWRPTNDLAVVNARLEAFWARGGLVTVSWHVPNPFQGDGDPRWDAVANAASIDLAALLAGGSGTAHDLYRAQVDQVAAALKQLHDQGIVVLWRPFHEMNGSWFWWGNAQAHPAAYQALWIDLHDTLSGHGLDNLLWVFGPNSTGGGGGFETFYPGDDHVDVVGTDYYGAEPRFDDAAALHSLGGATRPVVMAEVGPGGAAAYGHFDEEALGALARGRAGYFLQWHSWTGAKVAIVDNPGAAALMDDPDVVTLDALDGR
jgi:mannan endo-1,4-beta-mannosidase